MLDIGSGWGGLGLFLAESFEVDVTGVTLSTEQHRGLQRARPRARGWRTACTSSSRTTATSTERFDRIVSVGMFEHVGVGRYRDFFDSCATLLKPDGVMLLHSIGRFGPPAATNPCIAQVHLPGRLHPGTVGGAAGDRASPA